MLLPEFPPLAMQPLVSLASLQQKSGYLLPQQVDNRLRSLSS